MKKNESQNKRNKYTLLILFCLTISTLLLVLFLHQKQSQDLRSRALEPLDKDPDPNFCQNYCTGKDRCNLNDPSQSPDCCKELQRSGDPFACSWPDRGYCTISQCSTIPDGVNRQRCGGPRDSWCNKCKDPDNNCPGYINTSPSATPQVSPTPSITPTGSIAVSPSPSPAQTITPSVTPLLSPTVTVTGVPALISLTPSPTVTLTPTPTPYPTNPPRLPKTATNPYPSPPYCPRN